MALKCTDNNDNNNKGQRRPFLESFWSLFRCTEKFISIGWSPAFVNISKIWNCIWNCIQSAERTLCVAASQCIYAYVESTVRGGGAGAQCGPRWRQTGVSSLQHCSTAAAATTRSPAATTTTHEQSTPHLIILTFSFKKYKYWLA